MYKFFKRSLSVIIVFALFLVFADMSVFTDLNILYEVSAEEEITAADVINIIRNAPKHLNYFNDDTADALKSVLDYIDNDNLSECSEEELSTYYQMLQTALNGLTYKTAEVPQVYISTVNGDGNIIEKETGYVDTSIAIVDTDGKVISDDAGRIKVRGNSTSTTPKKPFKIKFSGKQNVLGMGKAKNWVLLADCLDPTLMRNYIAFDFAEYMGLGFTSQKRVVELWIDGKYNGCYLLIEPVEAGKTRVNINTEGNNDFLLEYEYVRTDDDVTYIWSNRYRFGVKSPEEPSKEQIKYITSVMNDITKNIEAKNFEELKKQIDVKSFVDYYILNEYFKTVDFGMSSVYYYYKDGLLYAGPPWDYDLSSGNINPAFYKDFEMSGEPDNLYASDCQLYKKLCQCEEFQLEVKKAFENYQDYIRNIFVENGLIDQIIEKNRSVYARNFSADAWDVSRSYSIFMRKPNASYEENVEFMRNWLSERYYWLCGYWGIDIQYKISEIFKDEIFSGYISENFDSDKDGYLSEDEFAQAKKIDISGMGISDMTGIEYFRNLEELNCSKNALKKLNLRRNTNLKRLDCSENKISYLDLRNNRSLISLDCSSNCMPCISLEYCSELTKENFNCSSNVYELKCGDYDTTYNFNSIPGMNYKKIKNLRGAGYNSQKGIIYDISDKISYKYSTGLGDVTFYFNVQKHDYGEIVLKTGATCVDDEVYTRTCSNCGDVETAVKKNTAAGHHIIPVSSKEPNCTDKGRHAYWKCDICNMFFSDAEGINKIYRPEAVSPLGHEWVYSLNENKDMIIARCKRDESHTASLKISAENAVYNGKLHEVMIDKSDWEDKALVEPSVVYEGDLIKSGTVRANVTIGEGESAVTASVTYSISKLKGDLSGNGIIDLYDVIEIAKTIIGKRILNDEETETADFNGDGTVDLYDAINIAEYLIKNKGNNYAVLPKE